MFTQNSLSILCSISILWIYWGLLCCISYLGCQVSQCLAPLHLLLLKLREICLPHLFLCYFHHQSSPNPSPFCCASYTGLLFCACSLLTLRPLLHTLLKCFSFPQLSHICPYAGHCLTNW